MTTLGRDLPVDTVVVAILQKGGRYYVQKREGTKHLDGYWEFPGGKIEPGESPLQALERELKEELGVTFKTPPRLFERTSHEYPTRAVEIHFYLYDLDSFALQNCQQGRCPRNRWVSREELAEITMPAANENVIRRLKSRT